MPKAATKRSRSQTGQEPPDRSPVVVQRRAPGLIREQLAAASAGRCEFPGCNSFLYEHPLTKDPGNFAEAAHIVAFKKRGPRGGYERPPESDINNFDNLMLLCARCHKLIDDNPDRYPVEDLKEFKFEHEARIHEITEAGPELRTTIIQLKGTIGGQQVDIPAPDVRRAVAPRYVANQTGHVIDLTAYPDATPSACTTVRDTIARELKPILRGGIDGPTVRHYSVFALAPIPFLLVFGRLLGDKLATDLYQRHRDQTWRWKSDGEPVEYDVRELQTGASTSPVGLVLSLSGDITRESLPVDQSWTLYEIRPRSQAPSRELIRQREDLERFRREYQRVLATITSRHAGITDLHLFPAIAAPIAIACGQDLLPKVHPNVVVYDNVKGRFTQAIIINTREDLL